MLHFLGMMTRLYFVRHADAYDEEGIQLDAYSLNNFGRIQALQLAKRLRENKFDLMYCSKIRRSIETCQIVNEEHDMDVIYDARLNEVGDETWPQPGIPTNPQGCKDFEQAQKDIYETFKDIYTNNRGKEIILFTHGNLIRVLLSKTLNHQSDPETFVHFVIANSSLTIIDIDDNDFEHIITVSDASHTQLYETRI